VIDGPRATVGAKISDPGSCVFPGMSRDIYDVHYELHGPNDHLDKVAVYFGYRSVSVKGWKDSTEGQPRSLCGRADQAIGRNVESARARQSGGDNSKTSCAPKRMGSTCVRKHPRRIEVIHRFLYCGGGSTHLSFLTRAVV